MNNIEFYPFYDRLMNDLELMNVYLTEDGLEVLNYGQSLLLCKYITGKQRVRVRDHRVVNIKHKTTGDDIKALEINFFAGPLIYLSFTTELEIYERQEIKKYKNNGNEIIA